MNASLIASDAKLRQAISAKHVNWPSSVDLRLDDSILIFDIVVAEERVLDITRRLRGVDIGDLFVPEFHCSRDAFGFDFQGHYDRYRDVVAWIGRHDQVM